VVGTTPISTTGGPGLVSPVTTSPTLTMPLQPGPEHGIIMRR
jgi:hypothetical protein